MAAIHQLIDQIEDERLRARLREEADALTQGRSFGLVFERHLPEVTPIYRARPRRGDAVAVRGEPLEDLWRVQRLQHGQAICQHLTRGEVHAWPLEQLLVVRRFGEPIFPALTPMDRVANGPADAPWHTLIEADNYHALQLLEYLYAGQVDCIYIDPPYNTGARDWKYNNDYVDGNDSWRHSKWLAFMARRLKLARRLLKPDTGVLVVTIDEHEVHHLGCLLEQEFPDAYVQMATIVINQKGVSQGRLARAEEYALFVFMPQAYLETHHDDLLSPDRSNEKRFMTPRWEWLLRGGSNSKREDRQKLFFPIYIDPARQAITGIGEPLPLDRVPDLDAASDGSIAWPVRTDGSLGNWQVSPPSLRELLELGYVRLGGFDKKRRTWTVQYLNRGTRARIERKEIIVVGRNEITGAVQLEYSGDEAKRRYIKTVWHRGTHDSGIYGSSVLRSILGGESKFSFPKSIYAVRDAIAAVVRDKPDALLVDFFAGSGTTLHAVNLLNALDGGRRRCIMVTNNEVGAEEATSLSRHGHQPGDEAWERQGICQSVTWPRTKYTVLGRRDDGTELEGEYSTGQTREVEKPRRFRHINIVSAAQLATLAQRKQFLSLVEGLPQTLARADLAHVVSEDHTVSVLFDAAQAEAWLEALDGQDHITEFIIVAPTRARFDEIKAQVEALLGPAVVSEELKRPMREGFPANVEYFRLDFLDPEQVALKRQFREVLPLLWMRAGCFGPRPVLPAQAPLPPWLLSEANRFAVLLEEERFREFLPLAHGRPDLTHVFLVTDAEEAFQEMAAELPPGVLAVQLYRDYLENFLINRGERA